MLMHFVVTLLYWFIAYLITTKPNRTTSIYTERQEGDGLGEGKAHDETYQVERGHQTPNCDGTAVKHGTSVTGIRLDWTERVWVHQLNRHQFNCDVSEQRRAAVVHYTDQWYSTPTDRTEQSATSTWLLVIYLHRCHTHTHRPVIQHSHRPHWTQSHQHLTPCHLPAPLSHTHTHTHILTNGVEWALKINAVNRAPSLTWNISTSTGQSVV